MESELDEELAYHLEREAEKLVGQGMDPAVARREALRRFGGLQRHREAAREAWGVRSGWTTSGGTCASGRGRLARPAA